VQALLYGANFLAIENNNQVFGHFLGWRNEVMMWLISTGARVPGNTITRTPYQATLTIAPSTKLLSKGISATAVYDADFATLTSVSSWQNSNQKNWVDTDSTPANIALSFFRPLTKTYYQEVYATSAGQGPLSWIVGGVFFHGKDSYTPNFDLISRPVPVSVPAVLGAPVFTRGVPTIKTNSLAGYAQATYAFTDQWRLTAGGRYTSEKKSFQSFIGPDSTTSPEYMSFSSAVFCAATLPPA